jgi:SAM-dependent methyltransferase
MSTKADRQRVARAGGYETARPEIAELVPGTARRILDLGCASGALGALLKREQPARRVVGVEYDAGYARDAERELDRVLRMDLDELPVRVERLTEEGPFDCILAADVLEHLRDPWSVLACACSLLAPDGVVIVSLPNVRHWSVLQSLLVRGRWPRQPSGIFDATHLRWFTLADALELLSGAGLITTGVSRRFWEPRRLSPLVARLQRTPLGHGPLAELVTYQHVLIARKP